MFGVAQGELFGLRRVLSSVLKREIPEEDLRAGGGLRTNNVDDSGNLRSVRNRYIGNGDHGRTYEPNGFISTFTIDWGGREDSQGQQQTWNISRIPKSNTKTVRGWMFCSYRRRPIDSRCCEQAYQASSQSISRACADCFEAALRCPRLVAGLADIRF